MEISRPVILLIIGLLFVCFITTFLGRSFNKNHSGNLFQGIIYEQPVIDGRYKTLNINNKRVYLSRYENLNQGDFISIDFGSCEYNQKYNSYDECEISIDPNRESEFLKKILILRSEIISSVKKNLPSPHDVLVLAMTIGYEDDLPDSLTETLREIGAIHMLVVSGYNISLVLNSSGVLLMRLPRTIYVTLSLFLLLIFVLITGFDAPVIRSAIMGIFVVVSKASSHSTASLYLLIMSGIVMASWNPEYLSNISFQLSFLATFGVIISGYIFNSRNSFLSDLGSSVGASLFVLPIISFYFGTVSFLGIISSLLLGWAIPLITYLGFIIFVFNIPLVNLLLVVVIDIFFKIAEGIAVFSYLNVEYKFSIGELFMYYALIAMVIVFIYKVKEKLLASYE